MVGSDGYVYEGRGWHWVGAHTRGHNSRGFGVAFVGNYTETLPTEAALRTVREVLPRCALRAGLLRPDYKLLGHRQLVATDCPGNALFDLLRTWPHFTEVSLCRLHSADGRPSVCTVQWPPTPACHPCASTARTRLGSYLQPFYSGNQSPAFSPCWQRPPSWNFCQHNLSPTPESACPLPRPRDLCPPTIALALTATSIPLPSTPQRGLHDLYPSHNPSAGTKSS